MPIDELQELSKKFDDEIRKLSKQLDDLKTLFYSIKNDVTIISTKFDTTDINEKFKNIEERTRLLEANNNQWTGKIAMISLFIGIAINFVLNFLQKRL